MDAGRLDKRLQFSRREMIDDGYGNTVAGDWVAQFTVSANVHHLRGGEAVIASRLEAKQPVIITIRRSKSADQISHEWRAQDVRTHVVYAISEQPKLSDDRGFYEFMAIAGVAA